jgi:hypothetical protein
VVEALPTPPDPPLKVPDKKPAPDKPPEVVPPPPPFPDVAYDKLRFVSPAVTKLAVPLPPETPFASFVTLVEPPAPALPTVIFSVVAVRVDLEYV